MNAIEKLTAAVMADPGAAAYYANLPKYDSQSHMIDTHRLMRLEGDNRAIAIELRMRQMAIHHFERPGVIECLGEIEKNLHIRPMGSGGSKEYKAIARSIKEDYASGNYKLLDDGARIQFIAGSTRVRCNNMPGSIAVVIAKYNRGLPRQGRTQSLTRVNS